MRYIANCQRDKLNCHLCQTMSVENPLVKFDEEVSSALALADTLSVKSSDSGLSEDTCWAIFGGPCPEGLGKRTRHISREEQKEEKEEDADDRLFKKDDDDDDDHFFKKDDDDDDDNDVFMSALDMVQQEAVSEIETPVKPEQIPSEKDSQQLKSFKDSKSLTSKTSLKRSSQALATTLNDVKQHISSEEPIPVEQETVKSPEASLVQQIDSKTSPEEPQASKISLKPSSKALAITSNGSKQLSSIEKLIPIDRESFESPKPSLDQQIDSKISPEEPQASKTSLKRSSQALATTLNDIKRHISAEESTPIETLKSPKASLVQQVGSKISPQPQASKISVKPSANLLFLNRNSKQFPSHPHVIEPATSKSLTSEREISEEAKLPERQKEEHDIVRVKDLNEKVKIDAVSQATKTSVEEEPLKVDSASQTEKFVPQASEEHALSKKDSILSEKEQQTATPLVSNVAAITSSTSVPKVAKEVQAGVSASLETIETQPISSSRASSSSYKYECNCPNCTKKQTRDKCQIKIYENEAEEESGSSNFVKLRSFCGDQLNLSNKKIQTKINNEKKEASRESGACACCMKQAAAKKTPSSSSSSSSSSAKSSATFSSEMIIETDPETSNWCNSRLLTRAFNDRDKSVKKVAAKFEERQRCRSPANGAVCHCCHRLKQPNQLYRRNDIW